jgi:hypothetical protein
MLTRLSGESAAAGARLDSEMVGYPVIDAKLAKPTICQIDLHFQRTHFSRKVPSQPRKALIEFPS